MPWHKSACPRPSEMGPVLPLLMGDDAAALAGQARLRTTDCCVSRSVRPRFQRGPHGCGWCCDGICRMRRWSSCSRPSQPMNKPSPCMAGPGMQRCGGPGRGGLMAAGWHWRCAGTGATATPSSAGVGSRAWPPSADRPFARSAPAGDRPDRKGECRGELAGFAASCPQGAGRAMAGQVWGMASCLGSSGGGRDVGKFLNAQPLPSQPRHYQTINC